MSCEPLFSGEVQTIGLGKIELCVFDVFEPLEEQWRSLEADGICSIYQRYDWIEGWASNVAEPSRMQPRIAIGTSKGETLFIFPLGLRKRGPFSIATWLADSHSNFHMGLYAKEFLQRANSDDVRKVLDCITSNIGRIDILELCCQPVAWQGYTNPLTFLRWQESHNHAYALDLEPDFKTALNRKNGSRKRKKHRWQLNRLKDVGGPVLRVASTPEEVNAVLDVSFAQMAARFDRSGVWNRFEDDGVADFFRGLAIQSLGQEEPALMVYGLEIDGGLRATFAGGIRQGQFSGCFISLADDEYSSISPGELIIYLVIEDCVKRGLSVFDLGRGEERYKTSWCDSTMAMFETNIAKSRRAIAFSAYERGKIAMKRVIRNNEKLWGLAKKVRAKFYGRI